MIRIGPVGWTHPALAGLLPPEAQGGGARPLAFLARYFGYVEADLARHAPLRRDQVARWRAALADAPRTRLGVLLPPALFDLATPAMERHGLLGRTVDALAPLLGRPQLGALVAELPPDLLQGPAEARELAAIARAFGKGAPLVLIAPHHSWHGALAVPVLHGAGWSLARLDDDEDPGAVAQLVPRRSSEGAVRFVRVRTGARASVDLVQRVAARVRDWPRGDRFVSFESRGEPAGALLSALALKRELVPPGQPLRVWREIGERLASASPGDGPPAGDP